MTAPVLVFGATGGIGEATARRLARAGHPVALSARNPVRLQRLAAELGARHHAGDVLDPAALARIVASAAGPAGLAGLVFAVGSIDLGPLRRADPDRFARSFALNVIAAAQAVRLAEEALARAGGAVVLFSSVAARLGFRNHSVIAAAKAGVEGLTLALAAELAPKVRVNCIAPSLTRTPLAAALTDNPTMAAAIAKQHALQRLGGADDVAALAVFLAGPDSTYLTGAVIGADGGRRTVAT
jgi:NAD(P)-dependent dehydrogenase (short-subunit alcohol dehydrogenase family)